MLPEEYCNTGEWRIIDLYDTKAITFDLPVGTPIYMPFEAVTRNDIPRGENSLSLRLEIGSANLQIFIVGATKPEFDIEDTLSKGEIVASIISEDQIVGGDDIPTNVDTSQDFNLMIYAKGYDLEQLYPKK